MDAAERLRDRLERYRQLTEKRDAIDREARAEREAAIREAAESMTRRQIAQIAGLSFQRVHQIITRSSAV